jgi:hypothetical protein
MNIQRRLLVAALVVVFVAGLFGGAVAQGKKPAGKIAKIVIENKAIQLGEVLEGQDYLYTFKVKNAGEAELQILSVRPG